MNLSVQEIEAKILTLSEPEQLKLIDFVESLKVKFSEKPSLCEDKHSQFQTQTEGERILAILETVGLLGCMKGGDGNLSENYKEHLWDHK